MAGMVDGSPNAGLEPGEVFAGYTIVRFIGAGGMGEVYLAQHPRLPRMEALKILGSDVSADDDYRQRFIREADVAAGLWHPNVVRVNDRGEFNGQLWIAMDFVDGTDAATLVRDHYPVGMPADEVAAILTAIASALDYAHQHHDLMHRDVSPANILLATPVDDDQRILLGDFGIARNVGDMSGLTATNMTIGTFPYAAPEQLTDEPIDGRADQYALAATVFHLLTGSPLFPHTNPAVVIGRHLTAPPPPLAETHPLLRVFDPVLAVALAKDPADRFARCADFAQAFTKAVHSGRHPASTASTMPRPLAVRPPKSAPALTTDADRQRRRRWGYVAAASTLIALTAVGTSDYTDADNTGPGTGTHSAVVAQPQPAPAVAPAPAAPPSPQLAPAPVEAAPPASPPPAYVPPAPVPRAPAPAPAPRAPALAPAPKALAPAPPANAPAPAPQRPAEPDQAYLNMMSQIPGVTVTDPSVAVATGRGLCTSLQSGGTPNDAANATVNSNQGITPSQAAAGVNAAISVYCPQYMR